MERMLSLGQLPVEYRLLGAVPEPWRPEDSMAVAKLVDYGLSFSTADLEWGLAASYAGSWILGLYLDYARWIHGLGRQIVRDVSEVLADKALGESFAGNPPVAGPEDSEPAGYYVDLEALREMLEGYARLVASVRKVAGIPLAAPGFSNNWVVHGMHTASGYPLLANDPHLSLSVPPVWYEAHLVANDTGLNVYGVAFPGIPFIVIGRNENVAFGFTNSMVDVVDLYYYVWSDDGRYLYKGSWLEPRKHVERILVRTSRGFEERTITVHETVHGRVVEFTAGNRTYRLAVRATTLMPSPVAVWAYLMNHAESVWDFVEAQRYFYSPIQNAVVADTRGNVLYAPVGLVPVRTRLPLVRVETAHGLIEVPNTGFLPYNGSRGEGEWAGFLPFHMVPRLLNPSWGYVATANNMIAYSYLPGRSQLYLQWSFLDSYRWLRIDEMLRRRMGGGGLTLDDMREIQMDYHSAALRQVLGMLLDHLPTQGLGELEERAADMLREWLREGCPMDAGRPEPAIGYAWAYTLLKHLWGRLAGEKGIPLGQEEALDVLRLEVVEYVLAAASRGDTWYLERLAGRASLEELAAETLREAVRYLRSFYGTDDPSSWIWGQAHRLEAKHALGSVIGWLNYPELEMPGGPFTVNVAPMVGLGSGVEHGPSVRFIADMSPGATGLIVIPGGNSGSPFSPYFDNQLLDWLTGRYHPVRLDRGPESLGDIAVGTAVFSPKGGR
ncbi:MAG: penicillin acylase family protein, partial [Thermoproteota archaeon]